MASRRVAFDVVANDRAERAADDGTGAGALEAFADRLDAFHGTDPTAVEGPRFGSRPLPAGATAVRRQSVISRD
jgi:hypothetical protein